MKQELLELLKCPYCGSDFEIEEIYEVFSEDEDEIRNGCIKCECSEYPILEGILILKNTATKKYIIEHLKKKEVEKAVALSFKEGVNDICRVADFIEPKPAGKIIKKCLLGFARHSSISNKKTSFFDALGKGSYEVYLKHRFSSQTFWSLYPFVPLLRRRRKRILEVCCGAGHASFVISNYVNPEELICVDGKFKSLYLAKKYFSNAEFINIDANYQLPFKDGIFSSVLIMDAFHYVDARALLAKEFERVLNPEGMLLLLHLHNALVENVAAGKPLSPLTWKGLFDLDITMLPEKSIVEDFVLRDRLDLSKKCSEKDLNSSDAILMIAGADSDCFEGLWEDILGIKENLIINPIYKMEEKGDKIVLEREFPSEFFRMEYPLTEKYLPERCEIDKRFVKGRIVRVSDSDEIEIEDLMRKFVIINVPENYIK
jgi:SAM-dependent methyltransferase/uncharacterized protein YbaR (Trm112 family)